MPKKRTAKTAAASRRNLQKARELIHGNSLKGHRVRMAFGAQFGARLKERGYSLTNNPFNGPRSPVKYGKHKVPRTAYSGKRAR